MKRNFGISQNVKSRLVCTCTPELFREAVDSAAVASLCAEIADALEAVKRGELSREEFDILKADRKRLLPVITPHATFTAGRRVNAEAVPSGLCMLDADHLPDARGFYEANVRGREEALAFSWLTSPLPARGCAWYLCCQTLPWNWRLPNAGWQAGWA